jgi:hypothetical protein
MKRVFLFALLALAPLAQAQGVSNSQRFSGVYRVDQFPGVSLDAKLQACISGMGATGGICDARSFGSSTLAANITVSAANVHVLLPCATITTAYQVIVSAGVRNTWFEGCAFQGGSTANGTAGGTVWVYTGSGKAFAIGDSTYAADTKGFRMTDVNLNTASAGAAAQAMYFSRAQEIRLDNLYLIGNGSTGQTGITLDGTGNYSGGTFVDVVVDNFAAGWYLTGHLSGSASGDYANASTFVRTHVDCPTSGGSPIAGTYGINIVAGDGNTWTGGDVEGCATMFHFGANAINNTVAGLRNENSTVQYQADSGSTYNAVFTGGTLFTAQLVDNGSRNSFWDAFHRTTNGMNGDWYASQKDATVINHLRLGIGAGNVRGLQWESQVDVGTSSSQYNWLWGLTDGAGGSSNWIYQDVINNVIRLQLGQLNSAGGNNQSALNAAGTGNVCLNCSTNSGTGGVAFGSGGASPTTVGTIDGSGNQTLYGYQRFWSGAAEAWRFNCASASACNVDSWTTGSAVHHLRLYNGGGTDIDSEAAAAVTVNNTSGTSGTGGFIVYGGGSNYNVAALTVAGSGSSAAVTVGSGGNTLYRCTTAGTLPVGALTTVTSNCGASADTGLRTR